MEPKDIVVTPQQLFSFAQCSQHMTGYVTPDDTLLIVRLLTTDGMPINLYLDMRCVRSREPPYMSAR